MFRDLRPDYPLFCWPLIHKYGNLNDIIVQLKKMGFPKMRKELLRGLSTGLPLFSVIHERRFGEDRIFFEFFFSRDLLSNFITLDKCQACYTNSITIEDLTINGVNTTFLDEQMKKIDWSRHFNHFKSEAEEIKIRKTLNELWKLSSNNDKVGMKIMRKLISKHFPQGRWNEYLRGDSPIYEKCRWTIHDFSDWNIQLCYLRMSGRGKNAMAI